MPIDELNGGGNVFAQTLGNRRRDSKTKPIVDTFAALEGLSEKAMQDPFWE
jgi:hypothetical protein